MGDAKNDKKDSIEVLAKDAPESSATVRKASEEADSDSKKGLTWADKIKNTPVSSGTAKNLDAAPTPTSVNQAKKAAGPVGKAQDFFAKKPHKTGVKDKKAEFSGSDNFSSVGDRTTTTYTTMPEVSATCSSESVISRASPGGLGATTPKTTLGDDEGPDSNG